MKNKQTVIAYLTVARTLPSSRNGNPRFEVLLRRATGSTDIIAKTAVDASLGYGIANHTGWTVRATVGQHYGVTTLSGVENLERGDKTEQWQDLEDLEPSVYWVRVESGAVCSAYLVKAVNPLSAEGLALRQFYAELSDEYAEYAKITGIRLASTAQTAKALKQDSAVVAA
jgi:hypothetical protein